MQFRLIGMVEIDSGGQVIEIGPPQQRLLAAALAVDAGRLVTVESLIDRVWDDAPQGARRTLHVLISKMRRVLEHARDREPEDVTVVRRSGGYVLQLSPSRVDLLRFRRLADDARQADSATRVTLLRDAVALWHGEPLSGLPGNWAARARAAWWQEYLEVAVAWAHAELRSGDPPATIGTLTMLAGEYPLAESVSAALMQALCAVGRPADALACYAQTRERLADELGIDPGPELQAAYQAALRDTSRLPDGTVATSGPVTVSPGSPADDQRGPAAPESARVPAGSAAPPPRELPAVVRHFTGRTRELEALTAMLDDTREQLPAAVVISAIGGTAGVGKTALAVHWAHEVAGRFPDGQLYVNLRGYDPGQPMPSADALAGFLRALGLDGQDIPQEEAERAARYRSLLAGRRILVVLDNARSAEHVRPLLPGTPTCVTVVTSRDSLAGLVARDGAVRLDLDFLPLAEAIGLLRALIGARVDAEPGVAAVLAMQCCCLPLALRVAAELAIARPSVSLAMLASELADQQRRLDLLDAGADPRTAVRAVFSWSCQHLDPSVVLAFRLLGLHPGPDLDSYGAAALTSTSLNQASQVLDLLTRAHLIQAARPGRYAMHDLLRAYARELAGDEDEKDERHAALTRLFDFYLHASAAAMDVLHTAERDHRPRIPAATTPVPPIADLAEALAWLDAERANLVAVTVHAARHGWPSHATRLSDILARYLDDAGHHTEAALIHRHALQAARHGGDKTAAASALKSLASVDYGHGRYRQAASYLGQALVLFRETGDQNGEAATLTNLGLVHSTAGRYRQAVLHLRQALDLYRKTGDKFREARALGNLGATERRQGRLQEAADHYQQGLALCRETGDRSGLAETLNRLGILNLQQNRHEQAIGELRRALTIFRQLGERSGESRALAHLGEADLRQGRYPRAVDQLRQALTIYRQLGDKQSEVRVVNHLGEAALHMGRPVDARAWHVAALERASQIGTKHEQADAHNGLARGYYATGDLREARRHWRRALAIYTDIGAPEVAQVRAQLATAETERGNRL